MRNIPLHNVGGDALAWRAYAESALREIERRTKRDEVSQHIGGEGVGYIPAERVPLTFPWVERLSKNRIVNPDFEFWIASRRPVGWSVWNGAGVRQHASGGCVVTRTSLSEPEVLSQYYSGIGLAGLSAEARVTCTLLSASGQFSIACVAADAFGNEIARVESGWIPGGTAVASFTALPENTAFVFVIILLGGVGEEFVVTSAMLSIAGGSNVLENPDFSVWDDVLVCAPWEPVGGAFVQRSTDAFVLRYAAMVTPGLGGLALRQRRNLWVGVGGTRWSAAIRLKPVMGRAWLALRAIAPDGRELGVAVSDVAMELDEYQLRGISGFLLPEGTVAVDVEVHSEGVVLVDTASLVFGDVFLDQAAEPALPTGIVALWPWETEPPEGWYFANGQTVLGIQLPNLTGGPAPYIVYIGG
jgi:hypothetical protein